MKYHSIFENIPYGIFLLSDNFEECNEQACQLLACVRDGILGHSLLEFSPSMQPDGRDSEKSAQEHTEAALSGAPQSFHWQIRRQDGTIIDTEISMKAIEVNGRWIVLLGMRDITERKQMEEDLRQSKNLYKTLLEISPIGIFHADAKGKFLYVNERWCEITGFTREEALHKGLTWGLHPEDRQRVLEEWCNFLETNLLFKSEYRIQHADGSISWVYGQMVAERDEGGELVGYVGTITDLTERKRIEEVLRESEERFRSIFESTGAGMAVISDKAEILQVNPALCRFIGFSEKELLKQNAMTFTHLADRERTSRVYQEILSGQRDFVDYEKRYLRKDGTIVWGHITAARVGGSNHLVGLVQDITDRKQAEEEVRQLNQELEARVIERTRELELANRELEAFTYSVSHDLRAPLRAIDGFSEALLEDYSDKLDEEGKTYLRYLKDGSRDMNDLIEGLLKLSRSTRGEMVRESVDLSSLVDSVVEELRQAEPERQVTANIAEGIEVDADPRLLKVVMGNLLGNAWKYTGQTADATIEFGVEEQEGETVYFVRDNGAGFDMAYADKLFLPFQRLHKADEFTGIGIGLATVQRIIHRHGGRIWAQGVVGEGSTFYFTLGEDGNSHE